MSSRPLALSLLLVSAVASSAAVARPGGMDGPGWGHDGFRRSEPLLPAQTRDPREGRADADGFLAKDALGQLGRGAIAIARGGKDWPETGGGQMLDDQAMFEAAVVDRLVAAGYETAAPDPAGGQIAELRVLRVTLMPAQPKPRPVSGEMTVGVDSRGGSMVGVRLAVDLRKPLPALVSTRLESRIRDRATGHILWEGHADMATYEGDAGWTDADIADKLAGALFRRFPDPRRDQLVSN